MTENRKPAKSERVAKLTKRFVTSLRPEALRFIVWDSELKGFGLRVEPSGNMAYLIRYRVGGGRRGRLRQMKLGRHGFLTPDQARTAAGAALLMSHRGEDPLATRSDIREAPTLEEIATRFLTEHAAKKRKASTAAFYKWTLEKYVLPAFVGRKAIDISRNDVARLHSSLHEAPYQANRALAVLSSLYSWAATRGLVPDSFNPARKVEKFPEEHRERYLTSEELGRLGEALRIGEKVGFPQRARGDKRAPKSLSRDKVSLFAAAAIRLLLFTGARLGEILTLRWDHVDVQRQALLLPDSKTGAKVVLLNAPALAVLASLPRLNGNPFVIVGTKEGECLADIKRPWRAVCAHAGLSGVRVHDLRHTFASYGAASNMGLQEIGRLLGHTSAATTARYAHLADDPLRRASRSIADTIAVAMGEGVAPSAEVVPLRR